MSGFESVFQRMDETIVDVCLRELSWDDLPAAASPLWRSGADDSLAARQRLAEVYRRARPLILHLIKTDKSPMKNMKKLSIARSMMDAGKKNFESNNTLDALNMYNKAVVFSPNIDDNLARACADRANCLLRLGDYARALADIEQAQEADEYQFERRFELDERKGLAYLGLGRLAEARAAFTAAISLLEDGAGFLQRKFVERKMAELQENLRACCSNTSSGSSGSPGVSNGIRGTNSAPDNNNFNSGGDDVSSSNAAKFQSMKTLPELRGRNRQYPALTEKVDVAGAARGGGAPTTIITANTEIAAGEIVGLEKPIASYLEKEFVKTNCWNCLVTLKAPFGCPLCSSVKFCSKACLQEACATYHPSECLLTDLVMGNRIGSWPLAFRAVASRPLKQILLVGKNGFSGIYSSNDLGNLVKFPVPQAAVSETELKQRTITAVFYLILLQMTGYFDAAAESSTGGATNGRPSPSLASIYQMKGKANDASLSDAELHVGCLLERIIAASTFCTTDVCHFEMAGGAEWTAGKVTPVIGKTINATLALVNHSCYPTAARVCRANTTLLIAQKNIRPGEAVTINYAAPFYAASRSDRRQYLTSGYELNCECDACRADWPLFDSLPPGPQGLADLEQPPPTAAWFESPPAAAAVARGFGGGGMGLPPLVALRPGGFTASSNSLIISSNSINHNTNSVVSLTKTEQHVLDTFHRVRSRIDQLQRSTSNRNAAEPPSKIMIQSQVRLFRCLLAMYSSKLYIVKTGYGTLPIPA